MANESRPVIADQTLSIDENSVAGTSVGVVVARDDDPDDTLTYRIAEGNTNRAFEMDAENGALTVGDGSELDHETTPSYTLIVEVSDGENTGTATITVEVDDLNEERLEVRDQGFSVDENSPGGTSVGTVTASGTQ